MSGVPQSSETVHLFAGRVRQRRRHCRQRVTRREVALAAADRLSRSARPGDWPVTPTRARPPARGNKSGLGARSRVVTDASPVTALKPTQLRERSSGGKRSSAFQPSFDSKMLHCCSRSESGVARSQRALGLPPASHCAGRPNTSLYCSKRPGTLLKSISKP